jgi:hypothetical protein
LESCKLTEKIENQTKKIDLLLLNLLEKSYKAEVDSDTDGKDVFLHSGLYSMVQKQKKTSIKQGKLKHKYHKQLTRNE